LLENPDRLQGFSVLRLEELERQALHLPRFRGLRVLTKSMPLKVLLPAGLGVLVGAFSRGPGGIAWIFALLIGSAIVTSIAQQTLP
jgi:hypothetical protein